MRKSTKLLLTAGALFAFVTGGGVLALARANDVTCPRCKSEALPSSTGGIYQIKGNDKQHERCYECQNSKCYYSFNVNEDHTFVGDSCEKTCSECGYIATVHTRGEPVDAKAATCVKDGYTGNVYCTTCNTLIEEGKTIPATGKHNYELKSPKAATCQREGYTGDLVCSECGATIKGQKTSKLNHTPGTVTVKWPTAPTLSNGTYTAPVSVTVNCARCSASFTLPDLTTNLQGTTPATCTEKATVTFKLDTTLGLDTNSWTGRVPVSCTKTYSVGETLGHDCEIKEGSWVWTTDSNGKPTAASATVTCKNCNFSTPAEVSIQSMDYLLPDCTTPSSQNYVATATYNGKKVGTDTRTVTIPATDHNYGENPKPVMAWDFSGANPTATATFTCETCKEPKVVNIASSDIGHVYQTSCTEEDHDLYTATFIFQGKNYEKTYTVAHPGTTPGHAYIGAWTWEEDPADGATLTLTCSKCNNVETFRAPATKKVTTPATCTTAGEEVYSVSYTYTNPYTKETSLYSDSKTVKLDPLGHDHTGTVTVAFDDDTCQTATATISCIRCSDTVTKPAVVTSVVTKPATCTAPGETTYTAAYGDVSTSKTVANIPALGHHFTNTRYNGDSTCEGDGTQTSVCDRCGATDTQTVPGSAGCTLHKVETAQVCPICGKVNGAAALNAVSAAADTSASTYGYRLVVRAGTLPNGRKVLTVAFLNAEGQAISLNGTQKVRISLAELNAQLGEDGAQGFAHTLTDLNTANGATGSVGFAVENGTLVLDAAFHNSTASMLLVD